MNQARKGRRCRGRPAVLLEAGAHLLAPAGRLLVRGAHFHARGAPCGLSGVPEHEQPADEVVARLRARKRQVIARRARAICQIHGDSHRQQQGAHVLFCGDSFYLLSAFDYFGESVCARCLEGSLVPMSAKTNAILSGTTPQ
jgi:hypothetical protein